MDILKRKFLYLLKENFEEDLLGNLGNSELITFFVNEPQILAISSETSTSETQSISQNFKDLLISSS